MALIKCPECGAEISDKATVCPKCGNLTNVDSITVAEVKEEQQTNNKVYPMSRTILNFRG